MGIDVSRGETEAGEGVCRGAKDRGEVVGGETAVVGTQRCGGRAAGLADGDAPFGEGVDRACGGVTTAGMTNDFALFAVFLVVEGEGGVRSPVQVLLSGSSGVQFMVPDCEGNVAQAQGVIVGGVAVFPGAQQEEEGDPDHVDGSSEFGRGGSEDESRGMVDDLDWEGLHTMWGRIVVGVGGVQTCEPGVHEASKREAWVGVTHVGEALRNGEDFVTYVWSPDRLTTAAGGP